MKLTFRKATADDSERIYQLCKRLIDAYEDVCRIDYDSVLKWVRKKTERCIDEYTVIYADGMKAGYYRFYKNGDGVYEIDDLYVFDEFQNHGIGSEVIRTCCESVNEPVILYVFIKNKRAVSLYERLGFEVVETVGESRYVMERRMMKLICEINDKMILGREGRSEKAPRLTARAIVKNGYGMYAVMHSLKFGLYSLPGGGVEDNEDIVTALRREIMEETGCTCDKVEELGIVYENRASLDYTQINHYFAVYTEHVGEAHLTDNELNNKTRLEWHTWDETVSLISGQEFERVQQKYLRARDVAALAEYAKRYNELYVGEIYDKTLEINMEDLFLIKPSAEYANQIAEYRQEFLCAGDSMDGTGSLRRMDNPLDFVQKCKDYESPETLPDGKVLATQFMLVRKSDNRLVGMIQVRHYFNDFLEKYAGHIGYSVRPSERRKGYAKEMLRMALPYCREIGLDRVLITCIDGNIGSEKTILANGGVYESTVYEPNGQRYLKRFWITLE